MEGSMNDRIKNSVVVAKCAEGDCLLGCVDRWRYSLTPLIWGISKAAGTYVVPGEQRVQDRFSAGLCRDPWHRTANRSSSAISEHSDCCNMVIKCASRNWITRCCKNILFFCGIVVPCRRVEIYTLFGGTCCLYLQGRSFCSEDGGGMVFRKVGKCLPECTGNVP
jgi:hypothetical protein